MSNSSTNFELEDFVDVYMKLYKERDTLAKGLNDFDRQHKQVIEANIYSLEKEESGFRKSIKEDKQKEIDRARDVYAGKEIAPYLTAVDKAKAALDRIKNNYERKVNNLSKSDMRKKIDARNGEFLEIIDAVEKTKEYLESFAGSVTVNFANKEVQKLPVSKIRDLKIVKDRLNGIYDELDFYTDSMAFKLDSMFYKLSSNVSMYVNADSTVKTAIGVCSLLLVATQIPYLFLPLAAMAVGIAGANSFMNCNKLKNPCIDVFYLSKQLEGFVEGLYDDIDKEFEELVKATKEERREAVSKATVDLNMAEFALSDIRERTSRDYDSSAIVAKYDSMLEKKLEEFSARKKTLMSELDNSDKTKQEWKSKYKKAIEDLAIYKKKINSAFYISSKEERLNRSILTNSFFLAFDQQEKPRVIKHDKYCTLFFYDKEKDIDSVIIVTKMLYNMTASYMKDGSAYIDVLDTVKNGTDFNDLLKGKESFNDDKAKMSKYLLRNFKNAEEFNKDIISYLDDKSGTVLTHKSTNIDIYNAERMETGNMPLYYRIPVYYLYSKDLLTNPLFVSILERTCRFPTRPDKESKSVTGCIPFVFVPYQNLTNVEPDAIRKLYSKVGAKNVYGLANNDVVLMKEETIHQAIQKIKMKEEDYKNSMNNG